MLIDYLVSGLQVIAFGFIACGCVLCLWGVALDAREVDTEPAPDAGDMDRLSSQDNVPVADAADGARDEKSESQPLLPMAARFGIRQAGSIKIR